MKPFSRNQISIQVSLSIYILIGGLHAPIYYNLNSFGYISIFLFFAIVYYCLRNSGPRLDSALRSKSLKPLNYIDLIIPLIIPALYYFLFKYSFINFTLDKKNQSTPLRIYLNGVINGELGFWPQFLIPFSFLLLILVIGIFINRYLHYLETNSNKEYEKIVLKTFSSWFFFMSLFIHKILTGIGSSYFVFSGVQLAILYWVTKVFIPKNEYRFDRNYFLLISLSVLISTIFISIYYFKGDKIADLITITIFYAVIFQAHYSDTKKLRELNKLSFDTTTSKLDLENLTTSLNPAFLLHTLQRIGTKSAQESAPQTASGINKLIGMMHHLLYVNKDDLIPIELEIIHLKNYIDFQMMRHSQNEHIDVAIDIDDNLRDTHIPPMVFLPFVENAFKYGISYNYPSKIVIKLYKSDNRIKFETFNSKHGNRNSAQLISNNIGIENTKKRLALLLPNKHNLIIIEDEKSYLVNLEINSKI